MNSDPQQRLAELELRVDELRRVNEELGRMLVDGAASRQPHSPVTAARTVTKLRQELEHARTQLEQARTQLEQARRQLRDADSGLDHFRRENAQLRFEAARLRLGLPGFLRRARARLLGR